MPDRRTAILLQRINDLCAEGKYEVIERAELLFPGEEDKVLDNMLDYLKKNEYVDVQYADPERGVYCLYPLPSGRSYAEKMESSRLEKRRNVRQTIWITVLSSAAGAALGAGAIALLSALWR